MPASLRPCPARRRVGGFTLIEMLIATSVSGILASVAYPSFSGVLHKARRTEALVAMVQLQQAQERWRANHGRYGSLGEIGMASTSPGRAYVMSVLEAGSTRYEAVAQGTGAQASDQRCRFMVISVDAGDPSYRSGATEAATNAAALNRQCWGQ